MSFECADLARDPSFSDSAPFAGNSVFRVAGPLASTPTDSFPGIGGRRVHERGREGVGNDENRKNIPKHIKTLITCQKSDVNIIWCEKITTLTLKTIENWANPRRFKRSLGARWTGAKHQWSMQIWQLGLCKWNLERFSVMVWNTQVTSFCSVTQVAGQFLSHDWPNLPAPSRM